MVPVRLVLLLALVVSIGCGSSGPPMGTVSGTVTMSGKPVSGATVYFGGKNGTGSGITDDDGKYSASVPVGDAKVSVNPPYTPPNSKTQPPPIYKKYQNLEKSTITLTVTSGSNKLDIDMK